MNNSNQRYQSLLAIVAISLLVSACASKTKTRQEDIDRYEALESQLIDQEAVDERRRKSDMRVATRLRQLEADRLAAEKERDEAQELLKLEKLESAKNDDNRLLNLPESAPVVTQVVVADSSDEKNDALWSLQDYPSPVDGLPICAVVSRPSKVTNGSLDTNVTVIIGPDTIYLRTDATFDLDAPETGFRIDAGLPILFDEFLNEVTALVDTGYDRLRNTIDSGSTLIVAFAYSPQLSSAETHVLELSLDSIGTPLTQLANCNAKNAQTLEEAQVDPAQSNELLDI